MREHITLARTRPGPHGQETFEQVTLRVPAGNVGLLAAFKAPLLAQDIPPLRKRLFDAIEELLSKADAGLRLPVVFTDRAQPSVREACQRERLGLVDQTGTVLLHEGPVYVHVEGKQRIKRQPRANLFQAKGARVLRCLLESPGAPLQAKEVAARTRTSFSYCYALLLRLESEGYVERRSPRTGFRLIRPVALMRAWMDSEYRAAASIEGFYAPSASPGDLSRLAQKLEADRVLFAFTLLSATLEPDVVVGGLPHGIYLTGDDRGVVEALGLRKITPHNFLILRPEADAATSTYGVFRARKHSVSRPQLILDLASYGGARGREQAEHLLLAWAGELPFPWEG